MPFQETSVGWVICFEERRELEERRGTLTLVRFRVISPQGSKQSIRIIFSEEFVDDYFHIPGDEDHSDHRHQIVQEKEQLFKTWSLVRIEELINKGVLEKEHWIMQRDFGWAEKVEKGQWRPSSTLQKDGTYIYAPERTIEFHSS